MNLASPPKTGLRTLSLWTLGFRPFFLAAGLWAATALAIWIVMVNTGMALPSRFDPMAWHIHEMLFGFVMATVAGFLLTAIPNWTGRKPVAGKTLAGLAALWLLGRIACLVSQDFPVWLGIAADLAFPLGLLVVVAREIIGGRNRRNMPLLLPIAVLTIANLLMHLEANGVAIPYGLGWRLALAGILVLISVIGGRIIPIFTRNWLTARKVTKLPAQPGHVDSLALATLHVGLFGWAIFPDAWPVGVLLLIGAAINLWRMARWQGLQTMAEPLLLILYIGYGWLCVGVGLLGVSILTPEVPQSAGIHAVTVGAIGTMILAVMTRVTRGHSGRPLTSDATTNLIFSCVIAAALVRLAAAFATGAVTPLLTMAALFWIIAFLLFVVRYGAMLLWPRQAG